MAEEKKVKKVYINSKDDRPLPHDVEAEKAVLSALLIDPEYCVGQALKILRNERVFYHPPHRALFKSIMELADKNVGIEFLNISHDLRKKDQLEEIGGEMFLAELEQFIATSANFDDHCKIVTDLYKLRNMINVCMTSTNKCYEIDTEPDEIINTIESKILEVRNDSGENDVIEFKDGVGEVLKKAVAVSRGEVEAGIPTGFYKLDQMINGGLKGGEMFVLAARPSIGKTSLALNILRNIAVKLDSKTGKPQYPVAFFSLEMTAEQIMQRLICTESQISLGSFYKKGGLNGRDLQRLSGAADSLKKSKIFIDETPALSLSMLKSKARRLIQNNEIKIIIVDYLGLMKIDGRVESRQLEVSAISAGVKELAKELDLPILILAQLNRESEKNGTGNAKPVLSNLRDSGAIEQDADVVAFLHRDRDKQKEQTEEAKTEGLEATIIIEKNRNGATGYVPVRFFAERTEFVADEHKYQQADTQISE